MREDEMGIEVTPYPNHAVYDLSVQIAFTAVYNPVEVCYHGISPERALYLLKQLEQQKDMLESMVKRGGQAE